MKSQFITIASKTLKMFISDVSTLMQQDGVSILAIS